MRLLLLADLIHHVDVLLPQLLCRLTKAKLLLPKGSKLLSDACLLACRRQTKLARLSGNPRRLLLGTEARLNTLQTQLRLLQTKVPGLCSALHPRLLPGQTHLPRRLKARLPLLKTGHAQSARRFCARHLLLRLRLLQACGSGRRALPRLLRAQLELACFKGELALELTGGQAGLGLQLFNRKPGLGQRLRVG